LLLGGFEAVQASPAAPVSCCCGDEDRCPCPPPPTPTAPRCPTTVQGQALSAPVAEAPQTEQQTTAPRAEAHPCPAAFRVPAMALEVPLARLRPAPQPTPPDTSTRLASLCTFRN